MSELDSVYFRSIMSSTKLYSYRPDIIYHRGNIVTCSGGVYRSLYNKNKNNNPVNSGKWYKLL